MQQAKAVLNQAPVPPSMDWPCRVWGEILGLETEFAWYWSVKEGHQ